MNEAIPCVLQLVGRFQCACFSLGKVIQQQSKMKLILHVVWFMAYLKTNNGANPVFQCGLAVHMNTYMYVEC